MASCAGRGSVAIEAKALDPVHGSQGALIWDRGQKGESLHQIARLFWDGAAHFYFIGG